MVRRKTRRTLEAENEKLRQDNATLRILTKAYMRRNQKLEDENAMLNASLDCAIADKERYMELAHKADERRRNYVRNMGGTAGTD